MKRIGVLHLRPHNASLCVALYGRNEWVLLETVEGSHEQLRSPQSKT
jgi:hypothetical protein